MKVGILYICTGKYDTFFEGFQESLKKFLPKAEKTLFVFTDSDKIHHAPEKGVVKIVQQKLGWPYDTMMRFHMFTAQEEMLSKMDYLFFFNANMEILTEIQEEEVIPTDEEDGLVAVLHPSYTKMRGTFETRMQSTAFVPDDRGARYFQGCLNGGKTSNFLDMCKKLKENIDADLKNNIIAIWHDESHMNCYMDTRKTKALHPGFAFPENSNVSYEKRILQIEKAIRGGHAWYRS